MATKTLIPATRTAPNRSPSPIGLEDLNKLKTTVMFTSADEEALRMAGTFLKTRSRTCSTWYGFVADHPPAGLLPSDGHPIQEYLDRVRERFGQWILDTCRRPYNQEWLDYQQEIALRHTPEKKNVTDNANSVDNIPLRYVIAFIYPVTATLRPFLAKKGHSADQVEAMPRPGSSRSPCRSRCSPSRT